MAIISKTQIFPHHLKGIYKACQQAKKLKTPQIITKRNNEPFIICQYMPAGKKSFFQVTDLQGRQIASTIRLSSAFNELNNDLVKKFFINKVFSK